MLVLIDTNVLLDSYLKRGVFAAPASAVIRAHISGVISAYMSATTVTDVYYQLRRDKGFRPKARTTISQIIQTFGIAAVTENLVRLADQMQGYDFEDDIQIACAMALGAHAIVTRDKKGFRNAPIAVLTPEALIKQLRAQGHKI